jgi:hypothetical protein
LTRDRHHHRVRPAPEKREEFLSKLEAHRAKPVHSHAWQEPLLRSKRIITCDLLR